MNHHAMGLVWAIDPSALPLHIPTEAEAEAKPRPTLAAVSAQPAGMRAGQRRVEVIPVQGILVPRCEEFYERYGYMTSTERLAARIESASAAGVDEIVLVFDSPGGTVAGLPEAAARIAAVVKATPIHSVVSHLCASAAYYLASQTTSIAASPSALTGSVGTIAVDESIVRMLDERGIDVSVIFRGEGKDDGHPATEITPESDERLQDIVDAFYHDFVGAVSSGRDVSEATVRDEWGALIYTSDAAVDLNMVDNVATLDGVINAALERKATRASRASIQSRQPSSMMMTPTKGVRAMPDENDNVDEVLVAAAAQIVAALGHDATSTIGTQIADQVRASLEDMTNLKDDASVEAINALRTEVSELATQMATRAPEAPTERRMTVGEIADAHAYNPTALGALCDGQFNHFGEYVQAVMNAGRGLGRDDRLAMVADPEIAAVLTGEEVELGGALVPEEFRAELMKLMVEDVGLRSRCTVLPMGSAKLTLPTIRDASHAGKTVYGGVRSYWLEAGEEIDESEPEFGQVTLTAKALATFTAVNNTMIADSAITVPALIATLFAGSQMWTENSAILSGNGAGMPLGINNAPCLLGIDRDTSNELNFDDIANMEDALLPESAMNAVYLVSPSHRSSIIQILKDVEGPESGRSMRGPMTLLGRPVIVSEHMAAKGSKGDILLADLRFYLMGDRQAMSMAMSQHSRFRRNQTELRMISRLDGQPWLSTALTLADGTTEVSPFVTLNA